MGIKKAAAYVPPDHIGRGVMYMVLSAFAGAVVSAIIKSLSVTLSPVLIFWISRLFPLVGLIPMALHGHLHHLKTVRLRNHLLLNCLYLGGVILNFYSLSFISLVNASLLLNCAPLYTPIISHFFIGEHFPRRLWIYVGISFIGVLCVLQPGTALFKPASLLAAGAGLLMAGAQVCNRHITRKEPPERVVFYMIVLAPILGTIPILFDLPLLSELSKIRMDQFMLITKIVMAGILIWCFQLFRAKSVAHAKVSIVMPFSYLSIVLAGILDWSFWHTTPNVLSVFGMVLIFSGTFFLFRNIK